MPGILVGVDGSAHSQRALEWAAKEAAAHHTSLTVLAVHQAVHGWTVLPFLAATWPWHNWQSYLLWVPMLISFVVFLVAAFAETNRLPFDLPES